MPEINKERWAEEFKYKMSIRELKSKDLNDIGAETNYEQKINKFKNGSIPSIDCFLTLCRFFNLPPDSFLFAKPKWVECDIDIADTGVSSNRLLGVYKDVFYVIPDYKEKKSEGKKSRGSVSAYKVTLFDKEPSPSKFSNFHLYGTKYDLNERVDEGKVIYRFPYVNDEKTSEKIFSLLEKKKFSNKQIQNLLEITPQSLSNRKRKKQSWTVKDIYKLSWILNSPFESLVEIDYREETRESLFDPIVFIMHYQGEYEEDEEAQL
ncbi:MAG: hypothetical protein IKN82_08135 [Treponema sp.]|nr:hypothetical protein [Treponema sp.]